MRGLILFLAVGVLCNRGVCFAEEPVQGKTEGLATSIGQRMDEIERLDREIAEGTGQLKKPTATPAARRQLQAHIRQLQTKQEQLLQELEKIVGPLPPAVRSEQTTALEQQLKSHERRHESTLESDVQRRLPR